MTSKIKTRQNILLFIKILILNIFIVGCESDLDKTNPIDYSQKVETPSFSLPEGFVSSGTYVEFTCGTEGSTIFYSTDGVDFIEGSAYIIIESVTLYVKAVKAGMLDSDIAESSYSVTAEVHLSEFDVSITLYEGLSFSSPSPALFVIWVEDSFGAVKKNIYVSNAVATNILPRTNTFVARPGAVPYWTHKACIEDPYNGIIPEPAQYESFMYLVLPAGQPGGPIPLGVDAVSGPTPTTSFTKTSTISVLEGDFVRVLLEYNRSSDNNEDFKDSSLPPEFETDPDDGFYDGSQSSLIWAVEIPGNILDGTYPMTVYGSGHPPGRNGNLYTAEYHTTSKDVVSSIEIGITRRN